MKISCNKSIIPYNSIHHYYMLFSFCFTTHPSCEIIFCYVLYVKGIFFQIEQTLSAFFFFFCAFPLCCMANIAEQLCLWCNLQATAKLSAKTVLICQLRGESFAVLLFLCCVNKSLLALKPLLRSRNIICLHVE